MQITKYYCDRCGREEESSSTRKTGSNTLWFAAHGGVEKYLCAKCYQLFIAMGDAVKAFLENRTVE